MSKSYLDLREKRLHYQLAANTLLLILFKMKIHHMLARSKMLTGVKMFITKLSPLDNEDTHTLNPTTSVMRQYDKHLVGLHTPNL